MLFEKEEANKVIWSKIKRVVSFRLEELRRETVIFAHEI